MLLGSAAALLALSLLAAYSYRTLGQWQSDTQQTDFLHHSLQACDAVRTHLQEAVYAGLSDLRTREPRYAVDYQQQKPAVQSALLQLQESLAGSPLQEQQLNSLQRGANTLFQTIDALTLSQRRGYPPTESILTLTVRNPRDELLRQLDGIESAQQFRLSELEDVSRGSVHHNLSFLSAGLASLIGLLALASVVLVLGAYRAYRTEASLRRISELHRAVFYSPGQLILTFDTAGLVTSINPTAEQLLGYPSNEVVAHMHFADLCMPGEAHRLAQELDQRQSVPRPAPTTMSHGTASPGSAPASNLAAAILHYVHHAQSTGAPALEIRLLRSDGAPLPVQLHLSAISDPVAEIAGFALIATDNSARILAENSARESARQYRDLFEQSSEMICALAPAGRYLYANPAWLQKLGLSSADMSIARFETVFSAEQRPLAANLLRRALSGESLDAIPLQLRRADGTVLYVEASLGCRHVEGVPVTIRCICHDITELRRRETRLSAELAASEIIARSSSRPTALPLVLEAIAKALGWEAADLWTLDKMETEMAREAVWYGEGVVPPDTPSPSPLRRGQGLPGLVWRDESPFWLDDFDAPQAQAKGVVLSAPRPGLHSGWGVPVRFEDRVIAAMQFYSSARVPIDRDLMTAMETVGSSLGQFMARCSQDERVRDLDRQKESILNTVAEGIFGTDPDGRTLFVNPAGASLIGEPAASLTAQDLHLLLHGHKNSGSPCNEKCRLLRALSGRESSAGQDALYRRDGSSVPVEFAAAPMMEHGRVVGTVLSLRDISQRHALDRMKDEFVSTVSHELRTPLTSIRGALGLLSAGLLGDMSPKAAELLRIAVANTDRLVRLINDILDLERMESGRSVLQIRALDIGDLARQAVETMQSMAQDAGIRLECVAPSCSSEADADRIVQVFTNLLSNAIKFSPSGSRVSLTLEPRDSEVFITVEDEGRGVPEDKLESIFDRFQQVDASDSRQKGGTGLGLAICRTILQQHGGRIWAERNLARGTTFRILMPRTQDHAGLEPSPPATGDLFAALEETVLVCDDDPASRALVRHHLQQHGYQVIEAARGEEAISLARQRSFSAILLDLNMPGLNGWETLNQLKNDPATAGIPVVILSVSGSTPNADGSEISGWIQKPINEHALLTSLGNALHDGPGISQVLVVEADEHLAGAIGSSFERAGLRVSHASTRTQAIQSCQRLRPDLMVLDISLPDVDGMQIVAWLRQHYELHKVPLVVYSGRDVSGEEMALLKHGPTQLLTRAGVQPEEVESLVLTMLRGAHNHMQGSALSVTN
jgi:PAS domain S-box-containing protein